MLVYVKSICVKRKGSRQEVEFSQSGEIRAKGSREKKHWREAMIDIRVKVVTVSNVSEDECRDGERLRQAR
jgi:uncharacterized beta-barrel protein YwiB (DUF1934 family)